MTKLKLGPISDDKPVKLTVELPAELHRDLIAYPTSPAYELTEYPLSQANCGRKLYENWCQGHDFPVHKAPALNPTSKNGQ